MGPSIPPQESRRPRIGSISSSPTRLFATGAALRTSFKREVDRCASHCLPDITATAAMVMLARDIDLDIFRTRLREIGGPRIPIYIFASKYDRALEIPGRLHGSV
jgi:esterase/lipase superfamily enzyme